MPRVRVRNFNSSVHFENDGAVGGINCSNNSKLNPSSAMTISLWIKANPTLIAGNTYYFARANAYYVRRTNNTNNIQVGVYNQSATQLPNTQVTIERNKWFHYCVTITTSKIIGYINGEQVSSDNISATSFNTSGSGTFIGSWDNGAGYKPYCSIADVKMYSRALLDSEVKDIYYRNRVTRTSLQGEWLLNEGSGTTATDSSGNGLNGTLSGTSIAFVSDSPMKSRNTATGRKTANPKFKNNDFENAPVFVAATAPAGQKWVDGTASGSTTDDTYGWAADMFAGATSVQFDGSTSKSGLYSLKMSATNSTGRVWVGIRPSVAQREATIAEIQKYLIPVKPLTTYKVTFWIKTRNVATNSAFLTIAEYRANNVNVTNDSLKFSGTNEWTQVTMSFTTASNTTYIEPRLKLTVAGNVSSVWFDNIVIQEVTTATTTCTSRTIASGRSVV